MLLLFSGPLLANGENEIDAKASSVSEEVYVVTATRLDDKIIEAPYTLNVIEQEQISRKQYRSMPEALSNQPGVMVQKTANGHGSPFIRGFTAYRTLALIDGIRYNNSVYRDGPNEYFSLIDLNSIDSIELLNGPASVQFGSDAIGGTLNLKTKSPVYRSEKNGELYQHGSQAYRLSSAENSQITRTEYELGQGQDWGMRLGYSYKGFGDVEAAELGTLPETGYTEHAYDARFDMALADKLDLSLLHQSLDQDDVWRTHSTIFSKSFAGTTIGSDKKRLKDQHRSLSYLKLNGRDLGNIINDAALTLSWQEWNEDGDRIRTDGRRNIEYFDSRMFGVDLQLKSYTRIADLAYGIDYYQDNIDSGRTDFNANGTLDRVRIQGPIGDDSVYSQLGMYIQAKFYATNRLAIIAGSRFSYVEAEIGKYEDPITGNPAAYQSDWTSSDSSLRAIYDLNRSGEWKTWAGISQSFRAPNIADLSRFGASRSNEIEVAATGLEPENFLTYEVGLKTNQRKLNATATYYYTDISDYITSTPTGRIIGGLTEVSKKNSSSGYVQGIELTADYRFDNGWQPYANVTWIEGELDVFATTSSTISQAEPLSRIMPLTTTAGIKWENRNNDLWFDLSVLHATKADKLSSGDKGDTQRIPPGGTPAYTLIDVSSGKKINDHLSLNLTVNNLLDEVYRVHGSGSNGPGLGVILGLLASF